jgi:hypothetical protein
MSVCLECYTLSVRGLCDELITRAEESYRLWSVVVCDLETSWMRRPWPTGGCRAKNKQKLVEFNIVLLQSKISYFSPFFISFFPSYRTCWRIRHVTRTDRSWRPCKSPLTFPCWDVHVLQKPTQKCIDNTSAFSIIKRDNKWGKVKNQEKVLILFHCCCQIMEKISDLSLIFFSF